MKFLLENMYSWKVEVEQFLKTVNNKMLTLPLFVTLPRVLLIVNTKKPYLVFFLVLDFLFLK